MHLLSQVYTVFFLLAVVQDACCGSRWFQVISQIWNSSVISRGFEDSPLVFTKLGPAWFEDQKLLSRGSSRSPCWAQQAPK